MCCRRYNDVFKIFGNVHFRQVREIFIKYYLKTKKKTITIFGPLGNLFVLN